VEVHVLQGEREMATGNKSLGRFNLREIPPAPRGVPQIEVAFDIDANGIVSVSAKDLGTGKSQAMTITGGTALDTSEIDQMVKDAEEHASEDHERRTAADARNQADNVVYQIDKQLKEHGDKLTDDERKPVDEALEETRKLLGDEAAATDDLTAATEKLLAASQVLGEKIYAETQEATGSGASEADGDEEVVEAEIVDEGDES
jgi:molecular chaperone DnaK